MIKRLRDLFIDEPLGFATLILFFILSILEIVHINFVLNAIRHSYGFDKVLTSTVAFAFPIGLIIQLYYIFKK